MPRTIYLDNNATTQPLPEVVEAMLPYLRDQYANPSSLHRLGQSVRHAVEVAREQVAALIHAAPREIIFTSGGTESINLAIRGAIAMRPERKEIVTTAVEHSAVLKVMEQLEREGYTVHYVGVDGEGRIHEAAWKERLTDGVALASFMHANNETGVMFDVLKLAAAAKERGILVHVDAVQSIGKVPVDVTLWPVHLVSMAAHKFHGPKGVGALWVQRRTRIAPMILGGAQERELRGGTENVAGIVGMGVAADKARNDVEASDQEVGEPRAGKSPVKAAHIAGEVRALRDSLERGILSSIPIARVNGGGAERLYNTTNISFEGLATEAILILLSEAGICVSSGAACSSGSVEPSHVLKAMGLSDARRHGTIRFSLSKFNTQEEIDDVVAMMPTLLAKLTGFKG